jgi:ATP-dependent Clp protease adaptor protein ClpS
MAPTTLDSPETAETTRLADRWRVVLLDDDDHTYEYVIGMLGDVFGHPTPTAFRMAEEVDGSGRVVVWTGSREVAEFKQERVHGYGPDPRIPRCAGSMSAVLERA